MTDATGRRVALRHFVAAGAAVMLLFTASTCATSTDDSAPASSTSTAASAAPTSAPEPPSESDRSADGSPDAPDGIGASGIGDSYYPEAGNGGYQIDHYQLVISYVPESNQLTGTATLTGIATAAEPLRSFNLDFQPNLTVESVEVGAAPATFTRDGTELVITPAQPIEPHADLSVVVAYGGEPGPANGGTAGYEDGGWYRTESGGVIVAGEPVSASTWYPVNEHPADPATYQLTVTVPTAWNVIAGGVEGPAASAAPDGMKTSVWTIDQPIASYLTTLYIDKFTVLTAQLRDGTPVVSAVDPGNAMGPSLHNETAGVTEVLIELFGEYPFDAVGGIYTNEDLPFALETATRPVYGAGGDVDFLVHELAHQWYGDDVLVRRWSDICLNECLASYAEWLYREKVYGEGSDDRWRVGMDSVATVPEFWSSPLVDMGAGQEFTAVYDRGPIALHVLRRHIGDDAFFTLLRQWPATHGGGNTATFADFEKMATDVSGQDLSHLFDVWFKGTTPPDLADYPEALR